MSSYANIQVLFRWQWYDDDDGVRRRRKVGDSFIPWLHIHVMYTVYVYCCRNTPWNTKTACSTKAAKYVVMTCNDHCLTLTPLRTTEYLLQKVRIEVCVHSSHRRNPHKPRLTVQNAHISIVQVSYIVWSPGSLIARSANMDNLICYVSFFSQPHLVTQITKTRIVKTITIFSIIFQSDRDKDAQTERLVPHKV